jgi:hypothetical protein
MVGWGLVEDLRVALPAGAFFSEWLRGVEASLLSGKGRN